MNDARLTALAERFCGTPLPDTVASDTCVTMGYYPHTRYGTNLMTVAEAKEFLRTVFDNDANEALTELRRSTDAAEGTRESLKACAQSLETYVLEGYPANENGQVDFIRVMIEVTVAEIRAFLATDQ